MKTTLTRTIILCGFLAVGSVLASANAASGDLTKPEALRAARQWAVFAGASDVAGLDALLGERYVHTHGTGLIETKKQFLDAFRQGARDYVRCKMGDLDVQLLGRAAIVAGTLDFKVMSRGRKIEGTNRFMMIVERTDKGVQVVAYQATPLKRKE